MGKAALIAAVILLMNVHQGFLAPPDVPGRYATYVPSAALNFTTGDQFLPPPYPMNGAFEAADPLSGGVKLWVQNYSLVRTGAMYWFHSPYLATGDTINRVSGTGIQGTAALKLHHDKNNPETDDVFYSAEYPTPSPAPARTVTFWMKASQPVTSVYVTAREFRRKADGTITVSAAATDQFDLTTSWQKVTLALTNYSNTDDGYSVLEMFLSIADATFANAAIDTDFYVDAIEIVEVR